jgi:hypothetical protein
MGVFPPALKDGGIKASKNNYNTSGIYDFKGCL